MNKNTRLMECWIWNETVEEFIKSKIHGRVLNCPCGKSTIGDVRCDVVPQSEDVIPVDYTNLPFDDNLFDTVVQYPPCKIGYYKRMRPFFECANGHQGMF